MSNKATIWNFTYNADGLKTSRSDGSTIYEYVYNGSSLSQITVGTNVLTFSYDANGFPLSVAYNGTTYYYVTNVQGDVIAILDSSGATVVTYTYDAWGNHLSTTGSLSSTLGTHNPLRYRGYVYDTETKLYYLQSRYYNPEIGRFLNGDNFASTGQGLLGNNMFAYCANSPILNIDPSGMWYISSSFCVCQKDAGGAPSPGSTARKNLLDDAKSFGSGVWNDLKRINFNIFNSNKDAVFNSTYVSFYKGQLVIREDWEFTKGRSGSFGIMFLNTNTEEGQKVLEHEYGHFLQLQIMGPVHFTTWVALPSIHTKGQYYYSYPWERGADLLGGVTRDNHVENSEILGGLLIYFGWFFPG